MTSGTNMIPIGQGSTVSIALASNCRANPLVCCELPLE